MNRMHVVPTDLDLLSLYVHVHARIASVEIKIMSRSCFKKQVPFT